MPGSARKACHSVLLIEGCHDGVHSQKAKLSYAFHFTEMPCYGKHRRHEWKPPLTARSMLEDLPKEKERHTASILLFLYMSSLATFTLFDEKQNVACRHKH